MPVLYGVLAKTRIFFLLFFLQDIARSGIVVEEEEDVLGGVIGY